MVRPDGLSVAEVELIATQSRTLSGRDGHGGQIRILTAYDSYYELRLYRKAPFRTQGRSIWPPLVSYYLRSTVENCTDSTWYPRGRQSGVGRDPGSPAAIRCASIPANYMSIWLELTFHGPAITPRVSDATYIFHKLSIFL